MFVWLKMKVCSSENVRLCVVFLRSFALKALCLLIYSCIKTIFLERICFYFYHVFYNFSYFAIFYFISRISDFSWSITFNIMYKLNIIFTRNTKLNPVKYEEEKNISKAKLTINFFNWELSLYFSNYLLNIYQSFS